MNGPVILGFGGRSPVVAYWCLRAAVLSVILGRCFSIQRVSEVV